MKENVLFEEDQKKIENAVEYHNMGCSEIAEIATLSALLCDKGVNVIKELQKMLYKYVD
ncbi:hypothetical protein P4T28_15400 [Bacillus paralicheniformis]|uniref:hypothetical protein n=1 Tax=Bacillus paralicheniformis TaxID=1648923 RepID=UPI0007414B34|nr:hypothetical protein [Bacillus paralicheniformis]KUL16233.1 hypothetical protein LI6934_16800 [Bacillus licheniformis LMG 6934]MED0806616.1 hypothetical protein [Bacillus paralicheniformis]TWJ81719.1 hypothetical protein CHCC5019_4214 [Bacillus paralicheniformis]